MLSQNYIVTLLLKTTEMHINYLRVIVFYLIMKVLNEGRLCNKKNCKGLVNIKYKKKKIYLGNIYSKRDWGMHLIM